MRTLKISLLVFILSITISSQDLWEPLNGPSGTPISHFASNSNNQIIAGGPSEGVTRRGGVFNSSDNGDYWNQIGLDDVTINALALNTSGLILVGTQFGIYRSTNNGDDWIHLPSMPFDTRTLTFELNNNILAGTEYGIYRSTDNGDSWIDLNNGIPLGFNVKSVAINSNGYIFSSGRKLWNPNWEYSIYRSTDNGENWTRLTFSFLVNSLVIDSNDNIYAGTNSNGVFRSVNDGDTWIQKINGLTNHSVNSLAINSGSYIFAGTENGVFYSANNGDNWFDITSDLPISSIKSLEIISNDFILAGTAEGVFNSSNNGTNWRMKNNGLGNTDIISLFIDLNVNVFAGTWGDGIYYYTVNGDDWVRRNNGLGSLIVLSFATNSIGHIFAGAFGVYRSTNSGMNWVQTSLSTHFIETLVVNSAGHIFAGAYQSVFRSTDNGETWVEVSNGFTDQSVHSLAINSNGQIFAGTTGDGVFRSTDNGDTWTAVNNGLTSLSVGALTINSVGDIFVSDLDVYRSTDNGNNWVQTSLSTAYISSIAIDTSGIIYVGSGYGVYRSTDNGDSWSEINEGLCFKSVSSLAISDDFIFAGIRYGGVFKRSIYTTSVENEMNNYSESFSLLQNYPNPFNPSTTIKYAIPERSFVSIKVYDVIGNEVATLVNEEKSAGSYEVKFSVGRDSSPDITSGIYFYRIQADNFIQTKKMILLK